MNLRDTLRISEKGHLEIGGCDTLELAAKYGTPLYVMDEAYIRKVCRSYTAATKKYGDALVCFASKAFSCKGMYKIVDSENLGADVASGGELYTAISAGFPADKLYFHGNNKTAAEIELAIKSGVHAIVADSEYELELINAMASTYGIKQNVMLRVNPGVDAHTHQFIQTARVDSKFGFGIADGAASRIIGMLNDFECIEFLGIHCHIGSQIFELEPFKLATEKMTDFIVELSKTGIEVKELNLGGGYGVHYTNEDKPLAPEEYVKTIVDTLLSCVKRKGILKPRLVLEPGRSIVGEAGITLYTVGSIKEIKEIKKYISVDGGMFENPRFALYQAKYEAALAGRMNEQPTEKVTVAGKCCESSDMLVLDAHLPEAKSGDILAVFTTGAYNYSMASNYNRNVVPPVVIANEGKSAYLVRPQTYDDIIARDEIPSHIK